MKNFSVQYLLSHIDEKKDVTTPVPTTTTTTTSSTLNATSSDDIGKKREGKFCFFYII